MGCHALPPSGVLLAEPGEAVEIGRLETAMTA